MKAIKIDVVQGKIIQIDIAKGIEPLYKELQCRCFTTIELDNGDILFLDDEGLLLEEPLGAFVYDNYPQPLSGHGIILGNDEEGESQDCKSTVEEIKKVVRFLPVQILKGIPLESNFIPLTDEEMQEYLKTKTLPIGKRPTNPN